MRTVFGGSIAGARKIDGQISPSPSPAEQSQQNQTQERAKTVRRINGSRIHFHELARMAYPNKTDSHLAFLARVDIRTVRRWLGDNTEPPADVLGLVLAEIMRRFHQRE